MAEKENSKGPPKDGVKLLVDTTFPVSPVLSHLPLDNGYNVSLSSWFYLYGMSFQTPITESIIPPFPQPTNTEDAIIEVLKYSQKDMDAAIAKVQAEVCSAFYLQETRMV